MCFFKTSVRQDFLGRGWKKRRYKSFPCSAKYKRPSTPLPTPGLRAAGNNPKLVSPPPWGYYWPYPKASSLLLLAVISLPNLFWGCLNQNPSPNPSYLLSLPGFLPAPIFLYRRILYLQPSFPKGLRLWLILFSLPRNNAHRKPIGSYRQHTQEKEGL